ncbi:phosphonate ABC transporter substrate-binding protein [Romeria aff. gracilis LEGE 07310]|uniref:Phosphonate ABC transporter substrate-binding protein n=1 Tax=Vasconcelosia minhoensis LEGE 07310 TaxID=915328 RepID=A0A8J7DDB4_9CYAN|nr:phosphonate ABC transporter substrate-binding protein [Romeria gracilis]MBE9079717.1 phosphonate ABC transporter substrate-binding protein [Romeria aff. gracilis LEGE 07310]
MLNSTLKQWTSRLALPLVSASLLAGCSSGPAATDGDAESAASTGETCAPELAEIDFGIISTESQDNLRPKWEPFLDAMEAELGRPVNAFYATDYAGVIEAMGAGKIQLAWYGGKSYIEAAERSQAEAFAQTVNSDGTKGYYSHLITNVDNPIVQEIDLEAGNGDQYVLDNASELTFAFNDPNSTSGFLVPSYYVFAKNGVDPNQAFNELIFAGSHEATAQAVANNQVDVATNNSESLVNVETSDPTAREQIQVIWTSPEIPSDPLAYRSDLPDCFKAEVQDFFYSYDDEAVLGPLEWQGFDPAGDEDWNTIRELEIGKSILEVQNNADLSATEKEQQIEALNQKLEALE